MRINRYLALATGMSRRAADQAVKEGRVKIDGGVAILGAEAKDDATITLDNAKLKIKPTLTVAFNKPRGYVTSRKGQGNSPTIYELLPPSLHHLKPVGRLDKDSSGLLVMTNNGKLAQKLGHPSAGKWKSYHVKLNRRLTPADLKTLENGVLLKDGPSRLNITPAKPSGSYRVRLQEGRNRQIRRSFGALKYKVMELNRTEFGDITSGRLPKGGWQEIKVEGDL